ncbi:MAG: hypothetical protein KAU02_05350 [Tenericutes bacterium]|nr:hypothetical protein [Mycoplasmatota bacterium]
MNYFESAFDIIYLLSVIIISILIIRKGIIKKQKAVIVFGIMGLLLGFGDSFHLIPRIIGHLTTGLDDYQTSLGIGKLLTGITMTIFYYLIYLYYSIITNDKNKRVFLTLAILIAIRFVFLALPGNDWVNNGNDLFYGILRNIPFALIGIIITTIFIKKSKNPEYHMFKQMAYWIIVSFVCYIIVILGSGFIPLLGAFMMPKTIAYFIIIWIGYKNS